jgi:hypothetical protein
MMQLILNFALYSNLNVDPTDETRFGTWAESETIDRGCPVQINKIFGSKKKNLSYDLYFSVNRGGAQGPASAYLRFAPNLVSTLIPTP